MDYTELHLHTSYSLLDGLNTPAEYMKRAKELGMTHLAVTDHGTLTGHREFQEEAKKAGITPILGCEMYISATDRFDRRSNKKRDDNTRAFNHLTVLSQNAEGLKNLNRLSEIAFTEGFYSMPRIDMEVLEEYNEGLVVTSGCLGGMICKAIENNLMTYANNLALDFKRIFGERFFIEIQAHNTPEINLPLLDIAKRNGIEPVVTSDCHFANKDDLWLEQAMLILASKPKYGKDFDFKKSQKMEMLERFNYMYPDRTMNYEKIDLWLHNAEEHMNSAHWNEYMDPKVIERAIANTMVIANSVGEYPFHEGLDLLPRPKTDDPAELLRTMAWDGLVERGLADKPEYVARLNEELDIICPRFPEYFIIEADTVGRGKAKGIRFGPGRGSGVSSLVNYALGITNVDPIVHNLLFFRFINPERNDYPDIDIDVEDKRRHEVKEDLLREYKHVASIATFGTFQGKRAVRDAARVFRVPLGEVNRALKGADWIPPMDWWAEWNKTDRAKEFSHKYPEVIKLAKFMFGRLREMGMHAGGIVLSKEPIRNYAPIQSVKDTQDDSAPRIPLVAMDMESAESVGFIKQDWLGLKALSIITDSLAMIKDRHGKDIDLDTLPLDDKKIYRNLSEGWTKGVFQCEANPYTNLLITMGGVSSFDDLVASNALVRPGATNSTAGASYVARNKGQEMITYHHPIMQEFTKETYGVVIYQEQVMLAMTELAGMKMSDADKVRKIIGKKRDVKEFEAYKEKWMEGATRHITEEAAETLWHDFEAHAGYSFNKSHAVAYSLISYWTAWLKEYYPLEFMTAVLSNEGDKDSLLDYLTESKRLGIRIVLPHINESGLKFEIQQDDEGDYIRFGLSNIKFISGKVGNRLLAHAPYDDYRSLYEKVQEKNNGLTSRALQGLNAVGAAAFPDNPRKGNERENFYEYLNIPAFETKQVPPKVAMQFRTLDEYSEDEAFVTMAMVRGMKSGDNWSRLELVDETGSAAVFASEFTQIEKGQLYIFLIANNSVMRYMSVSSFDPDLRDEFTDFIMAEGFPDVPDGMQRVVAFQPRTTKAGKRMATIVLADQYKTLTSALVWPSLFMRAYAKCQEGNVVDIQLNQKDDGTVFVQNVL